MRGPPVGYLKAEGQKYKTTFFWILQKKSTLSCNLWRILVFLRIMWQKENSLFDTKFSSNMNYTLIFHFPCNEMISRFFCFLFSGHQIRIFHKYCEIELFDIVVRYWGPIRQCTDAWSKPCFFRQIAQGTNETSEN